MIGLLLTIVAVVTVHCGDVCLQCNSVSHPQFCRTVQRCQDNEACFIDEHVISGHVTYSLGCRRQMSCDGNSTLLHHSQSDVRNCTHCCHGNLCNADGCGQTAYRQDRGPICYKCDSMTATDNCNQITVCGRDEACLLSTSTDLLGGKLYSTSCRMKAVCDAIHNELSHNSLVGRRSSHTQRHALCTRCCENDLCNDGCGDVHIDPCHSSPCSNGNCTATSTGYTCSCQKGFTGQNCNIDIDECVQSPCLHGNCINMIGGFICSCNHGYTGKLCEQPTPTDPCLSSPCNHGTCHSHSSGSFSCSCSHGFTGARCDTDINECTHNGKCVHGLCENTPGSYICYCSSGYYGRHCDFFSGQHAHNKSSKPLIHSETKTASITTAHPKLTTASSCKDLTSTLYCQTYKNSCWNKNIAYHCPHTCNVPGCPGPTNSPPTTTPSDGPCLDTVDNCAFIHSLQPGFCYSRLDYSGVHCRKFCRFC